MTGQNVVQQWSMPNFKGSITVQDLVIHGTILDIVLLGNYDIDGLRVLGYYDTENLLEAAFLYAAYPE